MNYLWFIRCITIPFPFHAYTYSLLNSNVFVLVKFSLDNNTTLSINAHDRYVYTFIGMLEEDAIVVISKMHDSEMVCPFCHLKYSANIPVMQSTKSNIITTRCLLGT